MGNYFITGASTGIGRATVEHLVGKGHIVFAGVRKQADADSLTAELGDGVVPVLVDVVNEQQVDAAAKFVGERVSSAGLDGLINNAGMGIAGPLERTPISEFRRQIEVNLIAQIAVTQAFLPLVRQAKGRIVFVGSMAGVYAAPMLAAYSASKAGLASVAQSLRAELAPWGMKVVLIAPGPVSTPITQEKSSAEFEAWIAGASPDSLELYARHLEPGRNIVNFLVTKSIPVRHAVTAMDRALFARSPRTVYYVGGEAKQTALGARLLPGKVLERIATIKAKSRIDKT